MRYRIILLVLLLFALKVRANINTDWEFILSTTSLPINGVTNTPDAKKTFMGDLYVPWGFKYNFKPFSVQLTSSMLSMIGNKDKDGGLSTTITQIEGGYFFNPDSNLLFKTQYGILHYEMKGKGGQKELRNGNSSMTFDLPSKSKAAQMFYLGLGTQYSFGNISCEFDLNILSPFSNTRRGYFMSLLFGVPL